MKVIGCGFGRTGTTSLKLALDQLGFGPTLHASEFRLDNYPLQMAWHQKVNGRGVLWADLLKGYESAVDWPVAYYWKPLAEEYPDAKIILTHRPAREWLASFKATILPNILTHEHSQHLNRGWAWRVIGLLTFNASKIIGWEELDFSDENLMRVYAKHIADVKAAIEPGRLLVFNVKDGWEPLCRFLGVPVPAIPFPVANDGDNFQAQRIEVGAWLNPEKAA